MTERKPPGVPFESWVDKQIHDAQARGDFDQLPGKGEPLPTDLEAPYDELWWVKRKMAREGLSVLPPALALRKEAEDALTAAYAAPSERAVRKIITNVNAKIRDMLLKPPPGPPLGRRPYDVEEVVRQWRERRATAGSGVPDGPDGSRASDV
ncbi:DUF1992 domain-containing protein [Streptomyces sp. Y7]|uniref:DnaJ family domain-containing protein n=1 Tax=Streptomyces sp. Y7 TaxID=3342392 RepID=UPI00370F87E0